MQLADLFVGQGARDLSWRSEDQGTWGKDFACRDQSTGSDQGFLADDCQVKHDGPHADQAEILDRTGVQDDVVADRHVAADDAGGAAAGDVHRAVVLDVGARADSDVINISTQDGVEPNTRGGADLKIADQLGTAGQ